MANCEPNMVILGKPIFMSLRTTFETTLPLQLRCRASMLALTSLYRDVDFVLANSLPVDTRQLQLSLEVRHSSLLHANVNSNIAFH
jgi:hypothetical protein